MKRRTFFGKALALLAAPFVAKAVRPQTAAPSLIVTAQMARIQQDAFMNMLALERLLQARADNEAMNRRQIEQIRKMRMDWQTSDEELRPAMSLP